jgi:Domain of unknown function (DUF4365)
VVQIGPMPRKRRTRQHVIADLSVNHVERFILDAGHTVQRLTPDYGYDLLLFTYDEQGYPDPGMAFMQLKAAETLKQAGADYVFDVDIRDYNRWMAEDTPVFLILFDAKRRRAYWLHLQPYFWNDLSRRPPKGARTVRVRVTRRQTISRRGVGTMRELTRKAKVRISTEGRS